MDTATLERLLKRFFRGEMPAALRTAPFAHEAEFSPAAARAEAEANPPEGSSIPTVTVLAPREPRVAPADRRATLVVGTVAAALLAAVVGLPSFSPRPSPSGSLGSRSGSGLASKSHESVAEQVAPSSPGAERRRATRAQDLIHEDHAPVELRPERRTTNVTSSDPSDDAAGAPRVEIEVPELSVEIIPIDEAKANKRRAGERLGEPTAPKSGPTKPSRP